MNRIAAVALSVVAGAALVSGGYWLGTRNAGVGQQTAPAADAASKTSQGTQIFPALQTKKL